MFRRELIDVIKGNIEEGIPEEIQKMLKEREEARKNKDWKKSDELREAIKNAGYILEDTKQGQKVRKDG